MRGSTGNQEMKRRAVVGYAGDGTVKQEWVELGLYSEDDFKFLGKFYGGEANEVIKLAFQKTYSNC